MKPDATDGGDPSLRYALRLEKLPSDHLEHSGGADDDGGGDAPEDVETGEGGGAKTAAQAVDKNNDDEEFDARCASYAAGGSRWNVGNVSSAATFALLLVGVSLRAAAGEDEWDSGSEWWTSAGKYVLAFGLFGFAGGATNWLAVKMLFDRVPGLVGSAVIPRRFKEIRETTKKMLMETFFEKRSLEAYLNKRAGAMKEKAAGLGEKVAAAIESEEGDRMLDSKLMEIGTRPEGQLFAMIGLKPEHLKPVVKPFVASMAKDVGPLLERHINFKSIVGVEDVHAEIEGLMSERLLQLTPERVKRLVEGVIRKHLGWLIVWGNVFGGIIGVIAQASGYS